MKKQITILLVCVLLLSCTACSFSHGNVELQEKGMLDYVAKYYGEAELLSKSHMLLDTATMFKFKDKQDGFEYSMTAMEVYMSDLGFAKYEKGDMYAETDEKTIVFDGQFVMSYVANLVSNKMDKIKLFELFEKYDGYLSEISAITYNDVSMDMFSVTAVQSAIMMEKYNVNAIYELTALMEEVDERGVLEYYIMPIYQAEIIDGKVNIKKHEDGSAIVLGYYDFYFDYILDIPEYNGVVMLHDYLQNQDIKKPKIISVDTTKKIADMKMPEGFVFLSKNNEAGGAQIIVKIDGRQYEFYTELGVKEYTTEQDEFGLHEGSYLDIMATERFGGAPIMVSWYATMYPDDYQSLTVYWKEYNAEEVPVA